MANKRLELIVDELLEKAGSTAVVVLEDYFGGNRFAGGKYSMGTHTITLYTEEIKKQCQQIFSSLDHFEDYFAVVCAHEIGHAEDRELGELADHFDLAATSLERNQLALRIEENAWEFAEKLLGHINIAFVKTIIYHSLQPYMELLEAETAEAV
jgi:predicted Zn-dependent protease with MMP-like domain